MIFDFTFCNFMLIILLNNKSSAAAASVIVELKMLLSNRGIDPGIPVLLTDNGGEFIDVSVFEQNPQPAAQIRLFFCDPMCSSQKPMVEKNPTLFRDIIPKGQSHDAFSQDTVNLIFSHGNSVCRNSLNEKTPFELFSFTFRPALSEQLGTMPY